MQSCTVRYDSLFFWRHHKRLTFELPFLYCTLTPSVRPPMAGFPLTNNPAVIFLLALITSRKGFAFNQTVDVTEGQPHGSPAPCWKPKCHPLLLTALSARCLPALIAAGTKTVIERDLVTRPRIDDLNHHAGVERRYAHAKSTAFCLKVVAFVRPSSPSLHLLTVNQPALD